MQNHQEDLWKQNEAKLKKSMKHHGLVALLLGLFETIVSVITVVVGIVEINPIELVGGVLGMADGIARSIGGAEALHDPDKVLENPHDMANMYMEYGLAGVIIHSMNPANPDKPASIMMIVVNSINCCLKCRCWSLQ